MPHAPGDEVGLGMRIWVSGGLLIWGAAEERCQKRQKTDKRWTELRPQSRNRSSNKYIYSVLFIYVFFLFLVIVCRCYWPGCCYCCRALGWLTFSHKIFHFISYLLGSVFWLVVCETIFHTTFDLLSARAWIFCFRSTPCVWSLNLPRCPSDWIPKTESVNQMKLN